MKFQFKISKRLWFLREKYIAEGLNEEEKLEYSDKIIEFITSQVLVKLFRFADDEKDIKKSSKIGHFAGMKH